MDARLDLAMRASDQDRDTTLARLAAGYAEGRLDRGEYDERATRAATATVLGELASLTADLPAPSARHRTTPAARAERDRRDLRAWLREWLYWLGGAVILTAVWGTRCLIKGEPAPYWPLAPLGIWAAVLVAIAIWPRGDEDGADGARKGC
ncbi:DUF1707 domain-containing protein [Embleya sp. NPDC056575]|uniref:DUF1707 SHOCT-like domain-containing protein n=1 Tax=unclassified Embleya TaxID=2699296 RepID=UPI0036B1429E